MPLTPEQQHIVESLMESAGKVAGKLCPGDDDARSLAYLALCEAVTSYKDGKGMTVRTWCLNHVKWAILRHRDEKAGGGKDRNNRKRREHIPLPRPDAVAKEFDGFAAVDLEDLLSVLHTSYREVFRQVVLENVPVKDISKVRGCSTSRIYMILRKCKERLRREIGDDSSFTSGRV